MLLASVLAALAAPPARGQYQFERLKSFGFPEASGTGPANLIEGSDGRLYGIAHHPSFSPVGNVIYCVNRDGSGYNVLHEFGSTEVGEPNGLLEGSDGTLYGTGRSLGSEGAGTVFRIYKNGSGYAVLHSITEAGGEPMAALIEGREGVLYGTTSTGGSSGSGTVFRLNKDGSGYSIMHSFTGEDGWNPRSALVEGSDGFLYGAAGVVFKLHKDGSDFTVLYRVPDDEAAIRDGYPRNLIEGADGVLYGTAFYHGAGGLGYGTLFKLGRDGSGYSQLRQFNYYSDQILVEGHEGLLYGTSEAGIFKVQKDGSGYKELYGSWPHVLIEGSDGVLYGTTSNGGTSGAGSIFKLTKEGDAYTVLRSFHIAGGDGYWPGTLTDGSDGMLYGTTGLGGSHDRGIAFKMDPRGGNYTVLWSFLDDEPSALIEGGDGALYGTTQFGGITNRWEDGAGTVFKLYKDGSGYSVLHKFGGSNGDGVRPVAHLLRGSDQAFYGTTSDGGNDGRGTVFKLNHDGTGYAIIHSFSDIADGLDPMTALVEGSDGVLYGATPLGGIIDVTAPAGRGTVFKLNKDGGSFRVLHRFTNKYLSYIVTVTEGSDGALYGVSGSGNSPNPNGIVFKLNKDGSGYSILHQFSGIPGDGARPSSLVEGPDKMLYGTTAYGGSTNTAYLPWGSFTEGMGTVFRLNKDGSGYALVHQFSGLPGDGQLPGRLIVSTKGSLYGTTGTGGDLGFGTLFALRPQPILGLPMVAGSRVTLRVSSVPGSTHQLQRTAGLGQNWLPLTNWVIPAEGVAEFTDLAPPQTGGFYRALHTP